MSTNAALVTDTAREISKASIDAYALGVQNHTNRDWAQHSQMKLVEEIFTDSNGNTIPDSQKLRILATAGNSDIAVVVPVLPFVDGAAGNAPSFTGQPQDQSATAGSSVVFNVGVTGASPISFQWSKGGVPISGATSQNLVLTNVQLTSSGTYTNTASNSNGITVSDPAVLTVTES